MPARRPRRVQRARKSRATVAASTRTSGAARRKSSGRSRVRDTFACVGLIVLAGCFTFVAVPDSELPWMQRPKPPPPGTLPTIVIDAGHGGNDVGASAGGLEEKTLTLDIARRVKTALESYNFPVVMTRTDDRYVPLAARVAIANRIENALFVSIHLNSHSSSSIGGVETFYTEGKERPPDDWTWVGFFNRKPEPLSDTGETLAGFIQASMVTKTDLRNRGIKSRSLYVTHNTFRPAVLIEAGFISNSIEAALFRNADYRQRVAAAIAEGVLSYQKTRPNPPEKEPDRLARMFE